MKVKQLIELLQNEDEETEVVCFDQDWGITPVVSLQKDVYKGGEVILVDIGKRVEIISV